jgi:hypothetical protein
LPVTDDENNEDAKRVDMHLIIRTLPVLETIVSYDVKYVHEFLACNGINILASVLLDERYTDDRDICLEGSLLLRGLVSKSDTRVLTAVRDAGLLRLLVKYLSMKSMGETHYHDVCANTLAALSHLVLDRANTQILLHSQGLFDILVQSFLRPDLIEGFINSPGSSGALIVDAATAIIRNMIARNDEAPTLVLGDNHVIPSLCRLIKVDMSADIKDTALTTLWNLKHKKINFDTHLFKKRVLEDVSDVLPSLVLMMTFSDEEDKAREVEIRQCSRELFEVLVTVTNNEDKELLQRFISVEGLESLRQEVRKVAPCDPITFNWIETQFNRNASVTFSD